MDEHLPYLRAICADPTDDLPRLVFADFLEETGDPDRIARAHFIRAQIALEQLPPRSSEFDETLALQSRLLAMYREDWIWDLPEHLHRGAQPEWRRGFIEFARITQDDFSDGVALFESVPITRVQIPDARLDRGSFADRIDDLPYIGRLTHLRFGPHLYLSALDGLLQSRNLTAVSHLDLGDNTIDGAALAEFILRFEESAFAPTLKELDLSSVRGLDDAVCNALATARGFELIERLYVKHTDKSDSVLPMLRRRFGMRVVF